MPEETCALAGLGLLLEPFYTNDVETKNRVLEQYKPQELSASVECMKNFFEEQKLEGRNWVW